MVVTSSLEPCSAGMLTSCRAISCVCEAILSTQLHCDIFMPVGKPQGADPLYRRTYNNASVLICKILVSCQIKHLATFCALKA